MVLKVFILPQMHLKANLFFPLWPPLTHPTTNPRDYPGVDTKRGEGGLTKLEKKLTLKLILSLKLSLKKLLTPYRRFSDAQQKHAAAVPIPPLK